MTTPHDGKAASAETNPSPEGMGLGGAPCSDVFVDPFESEEYQQFVAEMVPHCRCRANNTPCDGVLAGGPCDMIQDEEPMGEYDEDE